MDRGLITNRHPLHLRQKILLQSFRLRRPSFHHRCPQCPSPHLQQQVAILLLLLLLLGWLQLS